MSEAPETTTTAPSVTSSPQPLHNPSQAAVVQPPQAPVGGSSSGATVPGAGAKALLAKKMAKSSNPSTVSPTDNLMTPVSAKLNQAKKKHFTKPVKPIAFGSSKLAADDDDDDE
ncbi:hypothetical protein DL93DRAFT_2224608 [Clavulina sp. PMI_390]|nr:hypothetical protein DL93DRAFT_2224608 [Clavulina sp. PMI_390]